MTRGGVGAPPHHVDGLGVLGEAEGVAAGGRPEVYRHDDREGTRHLGSDLHPLRGQRNRTSAFTLWGFFAIKL